MILDFQQMYGMSLEENGFSVAIQNQPVGFTLEGSTTAPIFTVPSANLTPSTLLVTDDLFDVDDLSNQTDTDTASARALFLRWNVGTNTYWNYHVYVSVNGETPVFLGQTGAGDVNYFRWSDITLFATQNPFLAGPQSGTAYTFRIYGFLGQGMESVDAAGPVTFEMQ